MRLVVAWPLSKPITDIICCCARAASGHAAAAPPSSVTNSRRFTRSPRRRWRAARTAQLCRASWRSGVDDQLELARLHHRQVRRLRALEDAPGVDAHLTIGIRRARSVAHQPADFGILTPH